MRILALDQGTTSTRLMEWRDGGLRALGQLRHATRYPAPDQVEMDPAEILANCRRLLDEAGPADALAIANQGETCLAWDGQTGQALTPLLSWQDRRSLGILARLQDQAPEITARSGLPLDPYFSAGKLAWALQTLPEVARARAQGRLRLGTSDAFLLDRLAGRFVTDRATASRTGLMNLAGGDWDPVLCRAFGVPIDCLPAILPNLADFGALGRTPILAAITDQQAALYGHGARAPGQGKVTFGTGAFALAVTGLTPPDPAACEGLLPTVAWDLGQGLAYALDGGVQDAGSALDWAIRAGLANGPQDFDGFALPPAISRGLVFLPAFSGLGAPHWDRSAAPLILGLTPDMTRRDIVQALLEGIAFQTAELVATLGRLAGLGQGLSIDGGLTASRYFTGVLAGLTAQRLVAAGTQECTALGAAALAARALGQDIPGAAAQGETIPPLPLPAEAAARFRNALERARGWRR